MAPHRRPLQREAPFAVGHGDLAVAVDAHLGADQIAPPVGVGHDAADLARVGDSNGGGNAFVSNSRSGRQTQAKSN